jgi:hypothetical protein
MTENSPELNPQESPFEYLANFCHEGNDAELKFERLTVGITKKISETDQGQTPYLELTIKFNPDDKVRERYLIDADGVFSSLFEYPPLTQIPPAPEAFPADMTLEQSSKLAIDRTVKVAEFVQKQFQESSPETNP